MKAKRQASPLALAAVMTVLAAACGGPSRGSTAPVAPADLAAALAGLCRAADFARSGDVFEARRTFQNQSHAYLHELAATAEGRAHAVVARLLEAKSRVEAALQTERGGTPTELAASLLKLEAATRDLAGALGTPAPRCGRAG